MINKPKNFVPFEFRSTYNYYEPKIYDLGGKYFGGFNLRQIKRFVYVLGKIQHAYQDLYKHISYKKEDSTDEDLKLLYKLEELLLHSNQAMTEIRAMKRDEGARGKATVAAEFWVRKLDGTGDYFDQYPVRDKEQLQKTRYIWKGKDQRDRSNVQNHFEDFSTHEYFIKQSLELFFNWSHWTAYLFEGVCEDMDNESGIDLENLVELKRVSLELLDCMENSSFEFNLYRLTNKQLSPHGFHS